MSRFMSVLEASGKTSLAKFVKDNKCEIGPGVSEKTIKELERLLGIKFGPQYRSYLSSYGYISKGGVELIGVFESELKRYGKYRMVELVKRLRFQFRIPDDFIPVYHIDDEGTYYMVDGNDNMYIVSTRQFTWWNETSTPKGKFNDIVQEILLR